MNKPTFIKEYIYEGDTPAFRFTVTENSSAMDLTSATCIFAAKSKLASSSSSIFKKTSTSGTALGIVTFELSRDDTTPLGHYYGELEIKNESGNIITSKQFELTILPKAISSSSSSSSSSSTST